MPNRVTPREAAAQTTLKRRTLSSVAWLLGFFCFCGTALANISQDDFLQQQFPSGVPSSKTVWLTGNIGKQVAEILQHKPRSLRTRYWQQDQRSVWVMDEIGKEKPITLGVVVDSGSISSLHVLAFRESRGWEIKLDSYRKQFTGLTLGENNKLSDAVDGITGATLSVRATRKVARIALLLDQKIRAKQSGAAK